MNFGLCHMHLTQQSINLEALPGASETACSALTRARGARSMLVPDRRTNVAQKLNILAIRSALPAVGMAACGFSSLLLLWQICVVVAGGTRSA